MSFILVRCRYFRTFNYIETVYWEAIDFIVQGRASEAISVFFLGSHELQHAGKDK
jgi:hypothetical protein